MALGDTYSIHVKLYAANTGRNLENLGDYYILIPYADYSTRLTEKYIVRYGLITGEYSNFTSWCPEESSFSSVLPYNTATYPNMESQSQNFRNYFPRTKLIGLSADSTLVIESYATGKFIEFVSSGMYCYPTLQDYHDQTNRTFVNNVLFSIGPNEASGDKFGLVITSFYNSLGADGIPNSIYNIGLNGFRSSQNSIFVSGYYYNHLSNSAVGMVMSTFGGGPEHVKPIPSGGGEDPFSPGGESEPGGGEGDYDDSSDPVDFPPLPPTSAVDTGFITLYNPSTTQLQNLANYMWSGAFDLNTFRKIFADPMDCILGLSIVPVAIPNGGTKNVTVGNISTGVSMTVAQSQYVEIDCGTFNITEFWGAYLDYEPYTKFSIYLPYIGIKPISADDIMGKTLHVKYHVDILSGACIAYIKCGDSVLYSYIGQCSSSIPISGNDWTNVINGALTIATAIGECVATGGAMAPSDVKDIASTAINSLKPEISKSGSLSGTGGLMGIQKPYLITVRPIQALPTAQNHYTGYPSFVTASLASLSGYTEIDQIHLENIPATDIELSEIESLLKGGVIL